MVQCREKSCSGRHHALHWPWFPCCVILEAAGNLWIISENYLYLFLAWRIAVCAMNIADHCTSKICVWMAAHKKRDGLCIWFLYLWCWNLHWGWLTGLIAVLTVVFEVAEFLLLVTKPLWLFDCLLCSIVASAISFRWSICHFLVIPQALLHAHVRWCVHRLPDKFHVQQSSSLESFSSCYGQLI